METEKILIEAKGIELANDKISKKGGLALGGVNFRINAGEFVIFFGLSSSEKLQIFYFLAGLLKPSKGEISINSKAVFIDSSLDLISTLSVLDNVSLPLVLRGVSEKLRHKAAVFMLRKFGVDKKMYKFPQEISKKEQQLVVMARSLIDNPKIILLDDPVKKLGFKSSKIILDILFNLNIKEKKTIIMAVDDSELFCYADRILFFKEGKIIKEGINTKKPDLFNISSKEFLKTNNLDFAEALSDYFLNLDDFHLKNRLKDFFLKRFENKLSDGSLEDLLRRPIKDGGLGFSEEKTKEALGRVALVFLKRKILEKEQKKESLDVGDLRARILLDYPKKLSLVQINRLEELIEGLFWKMITERQFKKILILPEVFFGVGLNSAEAKRIFLKLKDLLPNAASGKRRV